MNYKIEKNTVQETLIIPLYARKVCSELYPSLYRDETSIRLLDEIDYDFSAAEQKSRSLMQRFGALEVAMRQNDLAFEVRDYLKAHPNAAVVNLGCGLDNTGRVCDNGSCKLYNLDFSDVIAVRNELLPAGEREENIPCDLNDTAAWLGRLDVSNGAVFFASGVFYYFLKEQVKALVLALADACPEGALVFDAANQTAVKMISKTWLKGAKIKDVGAYFAVSDAQKELSPWSSRLHVSSRGYMLGSFILSMPERPDVERLTDFYAKAMMTKLMKWFCRRSGKSKFTDKDIAGMKATASLKAADRNPYSWNMEFLPYPDDSGYEARFSKCGICTLMKELNLYDLTPALCHLDHTMSEAGGTSDFVRQHTLASGGPYCDCGYHKKL